VKHEIYFRCYLSHWCSMYDYFGKQLFLAQLPCTLSCHLFQAQNCRILIEYGRIHAVLFDLGMWICIYARREGKNLVDTYSHTKKYWDIQMFFHIFFRFWQQKQKMKFLSLIKDKTFLFSPIRWSSLELLISEN
jgi:hypothetical protein